MLTAFSATAEAERADAVFLSNHVLTMAHRAQKPAAPLAVAVKAGKILWVGSHDAVTPFIDEQTEIVALGDAALLPGFIDAHGHAGFLALSSQMANVAPPPIGPVDNINDLQNTLRTYIKTRQIPPGEWVIGRGYDDSLLAEQRHPDAADLNEVSQQHPILLLHVSGHLAAANSRALSRGGINAETLDPPGGIIRRLPGSNEPSGVLEETATYTLRKYMNAPVKDPVASVAQDMAIYARNGITTAQDGAASAEVVQLLKAADKAGHLPMDVIAYPMGQPDSETISDAFTFGTYDGRVKVGGVKLMLDGSPQGKTAYMTKPYLHPPHGQDAAYRGYPNLPQPKVDELVASYFSKGIPIIAHANGDAAADMLIEAVSNAKPTHDHRTTMIHAQTVREDQLTQMKSLAMIPSFFAAHSFYWGDWHRDSVFGTERASRISPTASTVARGMVFTVHNDAPVVPPDMIRLLWATTNRITRSGKTLGKAQRISTYDALKAMTINAAFQHFEEQLKGSIETGKRADFVVLSENPLTKPAVDLLELKVRGTYVGGEPIFLAD